MGHFAPSFLASAIEDHGQLLIVLIQLVVLITVARIFAAWFKRLGQLAAVGEISVCCMLVMMALVTTAMATPLLVRAVRGTEMEADYRRSGFLRMRPSPA